MPKISIGKLNEVAGKWVVRFVLGCSILVTVILYSLVKSQQVVTSLNSKSQLDTYLLEN